MNKLLCRFYCYK